MNKTLLLKQFNSWFSETLHNVTNRKVFVSCLPVCKKVKNWQHLFAYDLNNLFILKYCSPDIARINYNTICFLERVTSLLPLFKHLTLSLSLIGIH